MLYWVLVWGFLITSLVVFSYYFLRKSVEECSNIQSWKYLNFFLLLLTRTYKINSRTFLLLISKLIRTGTRYLHPNLSESSGERSLDFHPWRNVCSTSFCRSTSAKSAGSSSDLHLHPTPCSVISSASSDVSLSKCENKICFRRLCNFYQWRKEGQLLNSITETGRLLPLVQAAEPQMKKTAGKQNKSILPLIGIFKDKFYLTSLKLCFARKQANPKD